LKLSSPVSSSSDLTWDVKVLTSPSSLESRPPALNTSRPPNCFEKTQFQPLNSNSLTKTAALSNLFTFSSRITRSNVLTSLAQRKFQSGLFVLQLVELESMASSTGACSNVSSDQADGHLRRPSHRVN